MWIKFSPILAPFIIVEIINNYSHNSEHLEVSMLIVKENDYLEVNLNSLVADYDRLTLTNLYQPIIGYKAVGLYFTLLTEADNQKINPIINHKTLFDRMQMTASDFVDSRKLLEAVGLLKTFVRDLKENKFYQYELYAPKTPKLFFDNTLLYGMLIKCIGENDANKLRNIYLINRKPEGSDITASFMEVFAPDLDDPAFRKAMEGSGTVIGRQTAKRNSGFSYEAFFNHLSEISQIKAEAFSKADMKEIERLATLYAISEEAAAQAVSELYDPYAKKGSRVDFEELGKRFMDITNYRGFSHTNYGRKGKGVSGETDLANKINLMEKVSPAKYLSYLQNSTVPASSDLKIINDISKKFQLPNAVINALIDYVLATNDNILARALTEKIAASLAREGVTTAIDAMNYLKKIRKRGKKKDPSNTSSKPSSGGNEVEEVEEPTLSRSEILDQLEEDDDDGED